MGKEKFFSNLGNFKKVSLGLVVALFLSWLIFNTTHYVPDGSESEWLLTFLSYSTFMAIIFGSADVKAMLYSTRFFSSIPRFFKFFLFGLFSLYFILSLVEPVYSQFTLLEILKNVPIWLAVIHAFVFATIETAIWQGLLDYRLGRIASPLVAGVFHMFIWSGGVFAVIPIVTLLFMGFSYFNWRFRTNKKDLIPAIALHTAYNFLIMGIIVSPF